jgi:pyruvate dehydrogenase complex dehydrogenase (E1) component
MDVLRDQDPVETLEWREALRSVLAFEGPQRVYHILGELMDEAQRQGAPIPFSATTPYLNTIAQAQEAPHPGNRDIEHRLRSLVRWNAMAIVLRANKASSELGGHIASFQSAALLYDTGMMHFWHGESEKHGGDLIYMQGHSSPGFYARAFLEGRLSEKQLLTFRQEAGGEGISSYPHPWLMPDFWLSLGRDEGVTKVLFDETTHRLIGCGIVGPNAGDLIAEAALAIEMGADAEDIALTIHPHPTLSETIGMAAEMFEGTITDLIAPRKK